MRKKDNGSKKQRLFVTLGYIFNTTVTPSVRNIPLFLENDLPSTVLRFGSSDDNEIDLSVFSLVCTSTL